MRRNKKGQSALEYVVLITILAAAVITLINGTLKTNVQTQYDTAVDKIDKSNTWLTNTMQ